MDEFLSTNNLVYLIKSICYRYDLDISDDKIIRDIYYSYLTKLIKYNTFERYNNLEDSNKFIINYFQEVYKK